MSRGDACPRVTRSCLHGVAAAIPRLVALCALATSAVGAQLAGLSLDEALASLEREGLKLLYSSQIVTPDMRVLREPQASEPIAKLRELLAPHGLEAVATPAGGYAIVRADATPGLTTTPPEADVPADDSAIEEVIVHASRYAFIRADPAQSTDLARDMIESIPGVSEDAVRIVQRLPGTTSNGLSARTHVRGSYDDELLVRFDGVRLYNPYHLKDFQAIFGLLDPEFVESVEYFSGGFPARFGSRAGGVLDIEPRSPQAVETLLGVSTLNFRGVSSGRAFDGRGEWLAGYRRSNLNAVLRALDRDVGEPEFEDFVVRYQHELPSGTSATFGVLGLDDRLHLNTEDGFESARARYRDRYVWARLERRFGNGLLAMLQFSDASLAASRAGDVVRPMTSSGNLDETRHADIDTLALSLEMPFSAGPLVSLGFEASDVSASYDYANHATFFGPLAAAFGRESDLDRNYAADPDGQTYSAYAAARHGSGPWAAELGLRWDRVTYGDIGSAWSPRVSVRRELDDMTALRFTVGRFVQMQAVSELDVEQAAPAFAPPESSWHAIVGYERSLPKGPVLRLEAFGKRLDHVRPRWENVLDPLVLVPDIEVDRVEISPDRSNAWGVELSLTAELPEALDGWFNYTWSHVTDEFIDAEIARSWDQRHAIAAGATWRHGRWEFTLAANWHSGWPSTPLELTSETAPVPSIGVRLGARNSERFPDYFSVDARAGYTLPMPVGTLEFHAEVLNLTNRENVCCREFEPDPASPSGHRIDQNGWLGVAPILGISWRF